MYCKECGVKLDDSSKFCKDCGTATIKEEPIYSPEASITSSLDIDVKNYMDNKIKATTKFSSVQDFLSNGKPIINKIHWVSVAIAVLFALIGYMADLIVFTYLSFPFALFWVAIEVFSAVQYRGYYKRKKYHVSKPVDYNKLSGFINETIGKYEGFTVGAYGLSRVKKHHVVQFRLHGTLINIDFGRKEDSTQYTLYIDGNPYNHCSHCARAAIVHPLVTSAVEYYDNKDNPQKLEDNIKFFKPEKSKNIVPLIVTILICTVVTIGLLLMVGYLTEDNTSTIMTDNKQEIAYINIVKNGVLDGASPDTITLGTAFENYFDVPKWNYFIDDDGDGIVEFSGEAYYDNERVHFIIQFIVDTEDSSFYIWAGAMDGYEMEDMLTYSLISNAYESVGVEWNPITAGLDKIDPFEASVELWKSMGYSDDEIETMLALYNEDGSLDQDKYVEYVSSVGSEESSRPSSNFDAIAFMKELYVDPVELGVKYSDLFDWCLFDAQWEQEIDDEGNCTVFVSQNGGYANDIVYSFWVGVENEKYCAIPLWLSINGEFDYDVYNHFDRLIDAYIYDHSSE